VLLTLAACSGAAPRAPVIVPAVTRSEAPPSSPAGVGFSVVRTSRLTTREGLVVAGGSFLAKVDNNFSAVLVKHGDRSVLFDTGLGAHVREQYHQDMPLWQRLAFTYDEPVSPVRAQLEAGGTPPITDIVLSHSHWDHASGVVDFPDARVWVSAEERGFIARSTGAVGGSWPSQVSSPAIHWQTIAFTGQPYEGFARSEDFFGDGSVIIVPLFGHTPGSVGLFVTVESGRRFFFCGDLMWTAAALRGASARPKAWPARSLVDADGDATQAALDQVRALKERHPDLVVVPAHDGRVQDELGYFPAWVR
jgi:glyoxylase-like metal-dependent hydrolase (beta-lactamase superfamily II)